MELKSNFHDREWIMSEVKKKYETAIAYYGSEDFIIGAFLVGSQNYSLDIESSDVDVKIYVLPSINSIIENADGMQSAIEQNARDITARVKKIDSNGNEKGLS